MTYPAKIERQSAGRRSSHQPEPEPHHNTSKPSCSRNWLANQRRFDPFCGGGSGGQGSASATDQLHVLAEGSIPQNHQWLPWHWLLPDHGCERSRATTMAAKAGFKGELHGISNITAI